MWDLSRCLGWQEGRLYNAASGFLNGAWLQPVVSMLAFLHSIDLPATCSSLLAQVQSKKNFLGLGLSKERP